MHSQLDGILAQMRGQDLPDPPTPLDTSGKKVVFGPSKKAWYRIHEWRSPKTGKTWLFGHFGFKDRWHEIDAEAPELTAEERARMAEDRAAAEKREAEKRKEAARLAVARTIRQLKAAVDEGQSAYLQRKGVKPEGCRFMTDQEWAGWIIIPLYRFDTDPPRLVGSQKIAPDGTKRFNGGMEKVGAAALLGDMPANGDAIFICEGYATGGSIRAAVEYGSAVFVALDAGNLIHVVRLLRGRFPDSPIVVCADDDWRTEGNPGLTKAHAAADVVGNARVAVPVFDGERGEKDTDFNDLQNVSGLQAVKASIFGAFVPDVVPAEQEAAAAARPENTNKGGGEVDIDYLLKHVAIIVGTTRVWDSQQRCAMSEKALKNEHGAGVVKTWMERSDKRKMTQADVAAQRRADGVKAVSENSRFAEMMHRYVYLDGSDSIFDMDLYKIISQSAMKLAVGEYFKDWLDWPARRVIRFDDVVFDPCQKVDPETHINLFRGLPTKPAKSADGCMAIRDLMAHLVNYDAEALHWLTCWLAYPLQHVGGKLATAVMMHGDVHGTGKSLFFEGCYKPIFGEYATTLGQHQLESQYTAWRSRKLFCLFEEVLSSNQKYSHTGTIKHMITGKTQNIEKKFVDTWEESNHMNSVFLSNALQPFHIEASDRRFLVVWPEQKLPEEMQSQVDAELLSGGVEAFYRYLLDYDIGNFGPHTKPPMTDAKRRLIDYGLATWEVFLNAWQAGELGVPYQPCFSTDLFGLYVQWCERCKEGKPLSLHKFNGVVSRRITKQPKHYRPNGFKDTKQRVMFLPTKVPAGQVEMDWLGVCVLKFKDAARDAGWNPEKWDE